VTLPGLPDSAPTELKLVATVVEAGLSLGFISTVIWAIIIVRHGLRGDRRASVDGASTPHRLCATRFCTIIHTPLDAKYDSAKLLPDWQVFWATAAACGDVLCSPHASYAQRRQVMGDWVGQDHADVVNLASLIEHGWIHPGINDQNV